MSVTDEAPPSVEMLALMAISRALFRRLPKRERVRFLREVSRDLREPPPVAVFRRGAADDDVRAIGTQAHAWWSSVGLPLFLDMIE